MAATRAEIAAGQYAAAARDRSALAAIRPLRGEELLWEGDILAGQGQPDAALAAWKAAWQQGVIDTAALRQIAADERAREDWTAERQALGALVALGAAQSPDFQRLGLLQALDAPDEAVATLAHAAVASPDPAHSLAPVLAALDGRVSEPEEQYLTRLAIAYVGLGELELAQTALERAVGTNPVYGEALAYLAYVRSRLGEPALGAAEQATALSPDNPTVFYLAGLVWKHAGRPAEARLAFEQAYALDSTNPAFAIEIASTHRAQRQEQTAELWMQQAHKLAPNDFRVRLLVAQFYVDDEYMVAEKGLPLIQQLAAEAPDNGEVHATLSWAYFVTGHVNQAFEEMNTALSLSPNLPRANAHMGALLESQNRLPEAVYYYDRAVQLDPGGPFGAFAQRALERINGG